MIFYSIREKFAGGGVAAASSGYLTCGAAHRRYSMESLLRVLEIVRNFRVISATRERRERERTHEAFD